MTEATADLQPIAQAGAQQAVDLRAQAHPRAGQFAGDALALADVGGDHQQIGDALAVAHRFEAESPMRWPRRRPRKRRLLQRVASDRGRAGARRETLAQVGAQGLDRLGGEQRPQGLDQIHARPQLAPQRRGQRRRHRFADDEIRIDQAHAIGKRLQQVFATRAPLRALGLRFALPAQRPQRQERDRAGRHDRAGERGQPQAVTHRRQPHRGRQALGRVRRQRRRRQRQPERGNGEGGQRRPRAALGIVRMFAHRLLLSRRGDRATARRHDGGAANAPRRPPPRRSPPRRSPRLLQIAKTGPDRTARSNPVRLGASGGIPPADGCAAGAGPAKPPAAYSSRSISTTSEAL
ncbi:hypothetical protein [Lysobacter enzymogenes]|uniref:hypothetical protein n=1 Tax=Lysobacter enzymogenes TaxID=69 RepID=UPI000F4B1CF1|nr:hypothetical protein [Lysobacter enzymogenes]